MLFNPFTGNRMSPTSLKVSTFHFGHAMASKQWWIQIVRSRKPHVSTLPSQSCYSIKSKWGIPLRLVTTAQKSHSTYWVLNVCHRCVCTVVQDLTRHLYQSTLQRHRSLEQNSQEEHLWIIDATLSERRLYAFLVAIVEFSFKRLWQVKLQNTRVTVSDALFYTHLITFCTQPAYFGSVCHPSNSHTSTHDRGVRKFYLCT